MNFKVRAYGRTELAQMYCPNLQPESAFRKLCRWISLEPELSRRLLKNGKMPPVRSFTPAEVKLIVERLGEPCQAAPADIGVPIPLFCIIFHRHDYFPPVTSLMLADNQ